MKTQTFQITYVEFDFDGEDEMDDYDKDSTTAEVIGTFWEAIDEDDLVEEVTTALVGVSNPLIIVTFFPEAHVEKSCERQASSSPSSSQKRQVGLQCLDLQA